MKRDFMKELDNLYKQSKKEISILEVPVVNFLSIQGQGNPNNNESYSQAVGALYGLAYNLKFRIKKGRPQWITKSCRWKGFGGPRTCLSLTWRIALIGFGK